MVGYKDLCKLLMVGYTNLRKLYMPTVFAFGCKADYHICHYGLRCHYGSSFGILRILGSIVNVSSVNGLRAVRLFSFPL